MYTHIHTRCYVCILFSDVYTHMFLSLHFYMFVVRYMPSSVHTHLYGYILVCLYIYLTNDLYCMYISSFMSLLIKCLKYIYIVAISIHWCDLYLCMGLPMKVCRHVHFACLCTHIDILALCITWIQATCRTILYETISPFHQSTISPINSCKRLTQTIHRITFIGSA